MVLYLVTSAVCCRFTLVNHYLMGSSVHVIRQSTSWSGVMFYDLRMLSGFVFSIQKTGVLRSCLFDSKHFSCRNISFCLNNLLLKKVLIIIIGDRLIHNSYKTYFSGTAAKRLKLISFSTSQKTNCKTSINSLVKTMTCSRCYTRSAFFRL